MATSRKGGGIGLALELARRATAGTGSSWAFATAVGVIVIWALTGLLRFSDTAAVINTEPPSDSSWWP
jgi:hypothetical protein